MFSLNSFRLYRLPLKYIRVFYSSEPEQAQKHMDVGKVVKAVNVAIIGAPNSGKSTLINNIVERKICAASNKVHTTTKLIRAMCFENNTQIIFLDTPGVVSEKEQKKYKLPASMIGACHKSLRCADVIGVVHDVANHHTVDAIHRGVIHMLEGVQDIPSFLILNKVDRLKSKKQLLHLIKNLTNGQIAGNPIPSAKRYTNKKKENEEQNKGYSYFSDVFLVSALNGDGVKEIKEYLMGNAKPASLHYSPDEWTDQRPESLIEEAVRAKFLDFLSQEIPYSLKTELEYYDSTQEDKIVCSVSVECPSERILKLISGAGGGRLNQIKSHVRNDLVELFKKLVIIEINLKVRHKSEE